MTKRRHGAGSLKSRGGWVALMACMMASGCGAPPGGTLNVALPVDASPNPVHVMQQDRAATTSVPAGTQLTYRGGPVISHVKIVQVLFGAGTYAPEIAGAELGAFYEQVTQSAYFDWMSEYNTATPPQTIGRGSFGGKVQISPTAANSGPSLSERQLEQELDAQISSGALPPPDANTFYMVNLPKGVSVSLGSSTACHGYCAFHGSFDHRGTGTYFAVLPDFSAGSGCERGCGSAATLFEKQTMVASHELMEAVTDADVSRNNEAWYDGASGEIGDICSGQQGILHGTDGLFYTLQKLFSNRAGDCILTPNPSTADFSLSVDPQSLALAAGTTMDLQVTSSAVGGAAPDGGAPVALALLDLPPGVTATFQPATVAPGENSTLTLSADSTALPVTTPLTLTGVDGAGAQTAGLALAVTPANAVDSVVNGGFERGDLTGWTPAGVISVMRWGHLGTYAALLGSTIATQGDSSLQQTFRAPPGATTLSLSYEQNCRDRVINDWGTATLEDLTTGTSQALLAPFCASSGWTPVSTPVLAGHRYRLTLTNHDDGAGVDPTYTVFDGVQLQ